MAATSAKSSKTASAARPKKGGASAIGAPAQRTQASRKGKRAWRKNIDIDAVEEGLEEIRAEERVVGSALQKKTDEELFQVDTKGDAQVRKALPRFSTALLTSTKILQQRSAVPAVFSRPHSSAIAPASGKRKISYEEKGRLLKLAKRTRKGPLNSVVDPTELGAGSALLEVSEAARNSGKYDVWSEGEEPSVPSVKPPKSAHPRDVIELAPITEPHQGTSYNPLASAHQELLDTALRVEARRARDAEKAAAWKAVAERGRKARVVHDEPGVPAGMAVDGGEPGAEAEDEEEGGEGVRAARRAPERKTKQQRRKAEKVLAEKRALAAKAAKRRLLASIPGARVLRTTMDKSHREREEERAHRALAIHEKLRQGLAGRKLGKHKVQAGEVDVQLGEELSESLRELKPEGNLFRDRFLSLQQRGLVEPRALLVARQRQAKRKEYEKHAWKRFD